jgi:hypothetical protein
MISFSITSILLYSSFHINYFEFYDFALFYAMGALTLIWEQDPEDRLSED